MLFKDRLKDLRKKKGITQAQLGEKVNVTNVSISGYENGNRFPDTETLEELASYFEVSTDYLLGRTDTPNIEEKKKYNSIDDIVKDKELHQWLFDLLDKNPDSLENIKQLFESINNDKKNKK
ncbi:XRE family transcriptional regulator [Listeria sp. SHR_NRA_18]|uniref:helix-turn-helix domain-containing protein n=1 Tax=Listeria sp. SHR_NRA_18 TaxID=2269046 RepID=UPI000F5FBEB3|nr:helix-turn-helix transcriptional regulator [Listeria sp. SHR_NRA_18]RQW65988.1 XRE family transcriptional regulator [Listeria sp. SHR_NRA_18]